MSLFCVQSTSDLPLIPPGKPNKEVEEIDKVMYHDWRLLPLHEEEDFKRFTPVPEPEPIRYVPYPPLLRAMVLAQWQMEGKPLSEPMIDLQRTSYFTKDYFKQQEEKGGSEGTPV
ncbi:hypothetical protein FKM82_028988 [Ascaphus truei]